MADIKVNPQTGELAVPLPNGGYRVYQKGAYKFNPETNQYAVPGEKSGWKLYQHERKGSILPLSRDIEGNLNFDMTAGLPGAILSGVTAPGDVASGKLNPESPEGQARAMDTASLMLGVNPMVASGDRAVPGILKALKPETPKVPTAQELKAAGGAGFEKAENMGVDYSPDAIKSFFDGLQQNLESKRFTEKRAPDTFDILREVQQPPKDAIGVSLVGLRDIREALGDVAGDFTAKKRDRKAATASIRELDSFLERPPSTGAMVGAGFSNGGTALTPATADAFNEAVQRLRNANQNAADAGAALKEANANYAAGSRSEAVNALERKGIRRAATANSGLNVDNSIRQKFASFLEKPKETRGYSPEELAGLERLAAGNKATNAVRHVGNLMGGGGGAHAILSGGFTGGLAGALGGPIFGAAVGAGVPLTGMALRKLAGSLTKREVRLLDEMIRKRSPLYQKAVANAPMVPGNPEAQAAIARMFLQGIPASQRQ